jgi:hypothetical protein
MRLVFVLVLLLGFAWWARAQVTAPSSLPGCIYNTSLPTLTTGQQTVLQCDTNGKLLLH